MTSQATPTLGALGSKADGERRFARYAWAVLAYTLLVILFGAVVRITGSGAGCGQHWPSCNGELIHVPQTLKTGIEYTHRATSGVSVFAIVGLLGAAFRLYPRGHASRRAAVLAFAMILVEALIGAVLVKFRLVENDASPARILVLPLHLVSTALLTGALAWCAYFARRALPAQNSAIAQPAKAATVLLGLAAIGILLVSASGAVTALGDTVYPPELRGVAARLQSDQSGSASLLQRMRDVHPFLAVAVAAFVAYAAALLPAYRAGHAVKRASRYLLAAVCLQVLVGTLNIGLSAPGELQVVHLLLANLTWIALIVLAAAARSAPLDH